MAPWFLMVLLFAVGRQARDRGGKLPEHFRPAVLRPLERFFGPRQGEVEAGVFENEASAAGIRFESEAHPRIADKFSQPSTLIAAVFSPRSLNAAISWPAR